MGMSIYCCFYFYSIVHTTLCKRFSSSKYSLEDLTIYFMTKIISTSLKIFSVNIFIRTKLVAFFEIIIYFFQSLTFSKTIKI